MKDYLKFVFEGIFETTIVWLQLASKVHYCRYGNYGNYGNCGYSDLRRSGHNF